MARWVVSALLMALLVAPIPAGALTTVPPPVPPGSHVPLDASVYWALDNFLLSNGLFVREQGQDIFFVEQQMLGVLVYLRMAERDPGRSGSFEEAALDLWTRTLPAFNTTGEYFHTSVTTESTCLSFEPNAWALLAARELEAKFGERATLAAERADQLTVTLTDVVRGAMPNDVKACNPDANQKLVTLWALLRTLDSASSRQTVTTAVRGELDKILDQAFDGGFFTVDGIYIPSSNGQLLLALTEAAARLGDAEYAAARDELAAFVDEHLLVDRDGRVEAVALDRNRAVLPDTGVQPEYHVWLVMALQEYGRRGGTVATETSVRGLLETLFVRFWDRSTGGLVSPNGLLQTAVNELAVLVYDSPPVRDAQRDISDVHIVVTADASRVYPEPGTQEAARFLLTNEATYFFTVRLPGEPVVLFYPASELGDLNFNFPPSSFHPPPSVQRRETGTSVPVSALGQGSASFLRLEPQAGPADEEMLLRGYVPIDPLGYEYSAAIEVRVVNPHVDVLIVPRLELEIEASDVTWPHIAVNGITFSSFQATSIPANSFVPRTHTRMVLNNVPLAPGMNTVRLTYEDVTPPQLKAFDLYSDAGLNERLGRPEPNEPFQALTGQEVFVAVQAADNARVAAVTVDVRPPGGEPFDVPLTPPATRGGPWVGSFRIGSTGEASLTAFAEDASGFLSEPATERVEVKSSFFAGASVLLFVFAAGLFFATAFIYLKVRRRRGR